MVTIPYGAGSMDMKNCPRCGKVFVIRADPLCPPCMKEEEHALKKVRDYIDENPDKTLEEIAEECAVPIKRIKAYLRDGKLKASKGMQPALMCSMCGKPIQSGRMCEKCVLQINFQVKDMKEEAAARTSTRHALWVKK